jgi:hypothetical protein
MGATPSPRYNAAAASFNQKHVTCRRSQKGEIVSAVAPRPPGSRCGTSRPPGGFSAGRLARELMEPCACILHLVLDGETTRGAC